MKHTLLVTISLVIFFFASQIFGLYVINRDMKIEKTADGIMIPEHGETAIGPRPDIQGSSTFLYLITAVIIGTVILLIFAKFRRFETWKMWFFLAVWMAMAITIGVFARATIALAIAIVLALLKIFKPNIIIHNLTEPLVYSGIALLLVPLLNAFWAFMILLAFSFYDMFAVWKSRHMITLARFQMQSNIFAGFFVPYRRTEKISDVRFSEETAGEMAKGAKKRYGNAEIGKLRKGTVMKPGVKKRPSAASAGAEQSSAILGGGDIAIPMIFSGAVMEDLVRTQQIAKNIAFFRASIISVFAAIALLILLVKSRKERFYPAMPFIALGCLIGSVIVFML